MLKRGDLKEKKEKYELFRSFPFGAGQLWAFLDAEGIRS